MAKSIFSFAFLVAIFGCGGGSSEDSITKQQIKLNQAAVDELAKVTDLAAIKQLLGNYLKNRQKIMAKFTAKIDSVPKEKGAIIEMRFRRDVRPSKEKLDEALADFNKRVTQGKSYPQVLMETSIGQVKIELFEDMAPITVENFLKYVDEKFYDGTTFHRVISNFKIQGGGYEPGGKRKPNSHSPIENESYNGLMNDPGTLAMARTDNPDSATSKFFINVSENNGFLNKIEALDGYGYAVLGRVVDGWNVVAKIKDVQTTTRDGKKDVPVEDVLIKSIRRVEKKK